MNETNRETVGALVGSFMAEVHRYDSGRTLPILHRAELTTPQLATLEVLGEPKTVSSVASDLGLSMPATSQMIDKLVRKKLVRRTELSTDRRQRTVVLSAKGRTLLERINSARASRFDASLAVLPVRLRGRLRHVLVDVVEALREVRPVGEHS